MLVEEWTIAGKYATITHTDPDGLVSAYFLDITGHISNLLFARQFGATEGGEVMLDQVPLNRDWEGKVIDHHLLERHGAKDTRKYALIWHNYPTSLIVYTLLYDQIKPEDRWKVVVGCQGDGQPEVVPAEVWRDYPILRYRSLRMYRRGESTYDYPVYALLSSGIASLCRLGQAQTAYSLLKSSKSPIELVEDPVLNDARQSVTQEANRAIEESTSYIFGEIALVTFSSDYDITGRVAQQLKEKLGRTVICINTKNKMVSVRGELTSYIEWLFRERNILDIGGHPGYYGGTLKGNIGQVISILEGGQWK